MTMRAEEREDARRQPIEVSGKATADETGMAAGRAEFRGDLRRQLRGRGQGGRRHERIITGVDDKRGNGDAAEPWLAARAPPIIIGILVAVDRRRVELIEIVQRGDAPARRDSPNRRSARVFHGSFA